MLRTLLATLLGAVVLLSPVRADEPANPKGRPNLPAMDSARDAKIKAEVETILKLQKEGKSAEALQLTGKLLADHPTLAPAEQMKTIIIREQAVKSDKDVQDARGKGFNDQISGVIKGSTTDGKDISFPSGWKEKMVKRDAATRAKLNPRTTREEELLKWLGGVIRSPIQFKELPLQQALKALEQEGLGLNVSKRTLDELRLDYSSPATLSAERGKKRGDVLTAFLEPLGMTFIIKNEQITVMSKEEASKLIVTRVFPVDGLIGGPAGNSSAEGVIRFIEESVEPDSWKRNGGSGTINYFPGANVLIVRNSAAVISVLEGKFYGKK